MEESYKELIKKLTPENPWQINIEVGMSPDTCSYCGGLKPAHRNPCTWVQARYAIGKHCHAGRDGDCNWVLCPQKFDYKSWCPLAIESDEM